MERLRPILLKLQWYGPDDIHGTAKTLLVQHEDTLQYPCTYSQSIIRTSRRGVLEQLPGHLSSTDDCSSLLLGLLDGCQVLVHRLLGVERPVQGAGCGEEEERRSSSSIHPWSQESNIN